MPCYAQLSSSHTSSPQLLLPAAGGRPLPPPPPLLPPLQAPSSRTSARCNAITVRLIPLAQCLSVCLAGQQPNRKSLSGSVRVLRHTSQSGISGPASPLPDH